MSVTFDLPPEVDDRLDRLAAETGRSKASVLSDMVRELVMDLEDAVEAEQISERIRKGEERVYTSTEMRQALGLDD